MAIGTASDFVIYQDEFLSGMTEVEAQNTNAFNAASRNAIRLVPAKRLGDYAKASFFDLVASAVTRRDTTSVSAATDLKMTMDNTVSVKLSRKFGPIAQTLDAFKKIAPGEDGQREMSFILGQQFAKATAVEKLNTALIAAEAAIDGIAALNYDGTGGSPTSLTHAKLIATLRLFGDRADDIKCWVMHSGAYYDLMGNSISTAGFDGIATMVIREGTPASLGRPVVVTDSSALTTGAGSGIVFTVLGLVENAVVIEDDTEIPTIATDLVTGLENLVRRYQGEYAYNVGIKGFKYDNANGGANPTAGTIGTSSNWDLAASQNKETAGVLATVMTSV